MTRTPNTICEQCSAPFYKRPGQKDIARHHFCSTSCYAKWKIKYKKCELCGNKFHPKRRDQRFCSPKCAASRPRSLKWNGAGKSKTKTLLGILKDSTPWDGHGCMIENCGYARVLVIHRHIRGANGGKYVVGNMFAICPNHHAEIHRGVIGVEIVSDCILRITEDRWKD